MRSYSGLRALFPCCGIDDEPFDWKENIWVGPEDLSWIFLRYTWSCLQSRNKCECCVLGSESRGHPASAFGLEFWEAGVTSYSLHHCDTEQSQESVKWYLAPVDSKRRRRKGINLFHTSENIMQDHNHDGENVQWKGTRKLVLPDFSGKKWKSPGMPTEGRWHSRPRRNDGSPVDMNMDKFW